jgi:hypothetical protein
MSTVHGFSATLAASNHQTTFDSPEEVTTP